VRYKDKGVVNLAIFILTHNTGKCFAVRLQVMKVPTGNHEDLLLTIVGEQEIIMQQKMINSGNQNSEA
jgi:hypothetical protein